MINYEYLAEFRQNRWNRFEQVFSGDNPQVEIDPKVRELVVSLNVLGVTTENSCHGHLEKTYEPVPWILFTEEPLRVNEIVPFESISRWERIKELLKALRDINKPPTVISSREFVNQLIGGFYEKRSDFDPQSKLVIGCFMGDYGLAMPVILNEGGKRYHETDLDGPLNPRVLGSFQQEMILFGQYLRQVYFSGADIPFHSGTQSQ